MTVEKLTAWLSQLELDTVWQTALIVAASLLCITFHETCHGLVAYRLGDPTAKNRGRLTLNPIKHIDLMGLVMMAVCQFGWAKPVPVDMRWFKKPKMGMALTALAGPVSNVLLALVAAVLRYLLLLWSLFSDSAALSVLGLFFYFVELISAGLAVFNLFPIPPMDGSKVLFSFLPDRWYWQLMRYERYGMLLLTAVLLLGWLDTPLLYLRNGLTGLLDAVGYGAVSLLANLIFS